MTAHHVYRLYDADDFLIYIGCSTNVAERITHHRNHQAWWAEVARIDASESYPDLASARTAERVAIIAARPKHNVMHAVGTEPTECNEGSYAGYKQHRRLGEMACAACHAAHNAFNRERRARYLARGSLTHGKVGTYHAGCRCDDCREAGRTRAARRARVGAA